MKTVGSDAAFQETREYDPRRPPVGAPRLVTRYSAGLTKREMFAMAAMQASLSNPAITQTILDGQHQGIIEDCDEFLAKGAVDAADALIKALNDKGDV